MGYLDFLFFVTIDYMHCQQSLTVVMAEQVQCVGCTVDQCLIASIQAREAPRAWRKDQDRGACWMLLPMALISSTVADCT
jgi:hypothetical protein